LEDKTVLIIGIENSGDDMTVEVGHVAKQVLIMLLFAYDSTHDVK
jgi:hypothetical protein